MGFRNRNNNKIRQAERDWRAWIEGRQDLVRLAGLPSTVTDTEDRFVDFAQHGWVDHHEDPYAFQSDDLDTDQYAAYRDLIEAYFADGRGCFSAIALQADDYVALNKKYWDH